MPNVRPEFQVHILNDQGLEKAGQVAEIFSTALTALEAIGLTHTACPRERALVITKLQEAGFFAKRAVALVPENQK